MDSFLVLGYVPGTNLQINFQGWLDAAVLVLCIAVLRYVYKREQLRNRLPVEALLLPKMIMSHTVAPLQAELAPAESWLKSAAEPARVKLLFAYSRLLGAPFSPASLPAPHEDQQLDVDRTQERLAI